MTRSTRRSTPGGGCLSRSRRPIPARTDAVSADRSAWSRARSGRGARTVTAWPPSASTSATCSTSRASSCARGALKPKHVDALNRAVDALALPPPGHDIGSQRFTGHLRRPRRSATCSTTRPSSTSSLELCGTGVRLDHTYGIVMAPGTGGLGLHGGGSPVRPGPVLRGRRRPAAHGTGRRAVVAERLGPRRGRLRLHPREPQGGVRAAPRDRHHQPDSCSRCPSAPVDVVIFTEALTHGTLPWRAPRAAPDPAPTSTRPAARAGARTRCCRRSWPRCSRPASGCCSSRPTSPTAGPSPAAEPLRPAAARAGTRATFSPMSARW